mmetsp:Transcript_119551/g.343451  ORF Transcript_119551/g.343451 Transcript_119551/m.343451 type:complete len:274 (-) Transcript_119551:1070-1891(-)
MFAHLMSPCTIGGAFAWRYSRAEPTSIKGLVRVTSLTLPWLCMEQMNPSMVWPSTYSNSIANSALVGSMTAAWNATMCAWRMRRRSRNSLHKEAKFFVPSFSASKLGALIATAEPRKRPNSTQPKPPTPSTTGGLVMETSAVATIQCSRAPMSASCWKDFCSSFLLASTFPLASRSMSPKICSVVLDAAVLTAPASDTEAEKRTLSTALAASLAVVRDNSSLMGDKRVGWSSRWTCSTWLSPNKKQVSAPLTPMTASCARTSAKDSWRQTGMD